MHFSLITKITYQSILFIFLSLYLSIISGYAYSLSNKFYHFGLQDGLSQNSVMSIAQDHNGFMWFATGDGLNRFDGYEFEAYQHDANDPGSISDSTQTKIVVDKKGRLWIGTNNGGVDLYHPETKTFSHYRFPFRGKKRLLANTFMPLLRIRKGYYGLVRIMKVLFVLMQIRMSFNIFPMT